MLAFCLFFNIFYVQAENRCKAVTVKKVKAESAVADLNIKLTEQAKTTSRLQELLTKTQDEVTLLTQQKRHLEHMHEESEDKLRQVEHSEGNARERLEEAEEVYVLLQCEMDGEDKYTLSQEVM